MAGRLAHGRLAEQRNPLRIMRLRYRAGALTLQEPASDSRSKRHYTRGSAAVAGLLLSVFHAGHDDVAIVTARRVDKVQVNFN